jgi:hypothetical protein
MTSPDPAVLLMLDRMLQTSQDNVDALVGGVQRVARELSSLSFNYNGHMIRAGIRSPELQALDAELSDATTVLGRVLFDLQQRLLGDVQALRRLRRIFEAVDLEDERPPIERLRDRLDAYCASLEREHRGISETLEALSVRLRVMANNIEIAACRAGGEDASAPVDLFCIMGNLLRGLAGRLRSATGDLRIFGQTQNGHAETLRTILSASGEGEAA